MAPVILFAPVGNNSSRRTLISVPKLIRYLITNHDNSQNVDGQIVGGSLDETKVTREDNQCNPQSKRGCYQ